ncbi:N-acetyl-gamma-glutamyl-phosphate reductase [Sphingomicrobium sediminis]|uniref:N-acetyl-gamma-glutamyl-phosphate reductase n=1 Tax=Sphingomicrobium sediminis TaxID=2950949 RepID=A0A9X2EMP9_9SPHN|nr:N-acetyl-gamma-glutamyl-phosphate reductase [Sphingomicrobium sediminis]MCM8558224.1 N-acetyl-gamma-glutamyl-phosphate reductase [Sphingomicrobium sediminis]
MNTNRVMILGASGYVGGELLRLVAHHPGLEVAFACGRGEAGKAVAEVHPHLALAYPDLTITEYDPLNLPEVDLVFAALPHGTTQALAPYLLASGKPFVDLGADFRLDSAEDYATWYGEPHAAPQHLDDFIYGIPELNRDAIKGAKAVATAGCYATAAILTMKPLVDSGLVEAGSIIVNGMSGVSGAGKVPSPKTHFDSVHGSLGAYGLLNHRHTGEMQMALGQDVLFNPHLVPMDRGILVTCTAKSAGEGDPLAALAEAYADEPFIHISETAPATKAVAGTNAVHLSARRCARTGNLLALGAIDNLGKGAAGQMIQCANLMLGLEEGAGLTTAGVWP